ncbi:MAG: PIN domain-containing protein [Spirochaetota bacterium]
MVLKTSKTHKVRTRWYWFDTVVLSNFIFAKALPWIEDRYSGRLALTSEVMDELSAGVAAGFSSLSEVDDLITQKKAEYVTLSLPEQREFRKLRVRLGAGEASCIAAALSRGGTVVTDDRAARTECKEKGVPVTGTIGILAASCRDGKISIKDAEARLEMMKSSGFFSPINRIRDIL